MLINPDGTKLEVTQPTSTHVPADASQAQPQQSDLAITLQRCCDALQRELDDHATPSSRLALCKRGLLIVGLFLGAEMQQPIGAVGVDFVAAAQWLGGFYEHQAQGLRDQIPNVLITEAAPAQQSRLNVVDMLTSTSQTWLLVAQAAQRSGYADMIQRYEAWKLQGCEPDADMLEYFGGVAPDVATVPGILRIWTAVTAALATSVTSGQLRGGRSEVVVMTQVMVSTAREAAVMAAMLGGDVQGEG